MSGEFQVVEVRVERRGAGGVRGEGADLGVAGERWRVGVGRCDM